MLADKLPLCPCGSEPEWNGGGGTSGGGVSTTHFLCVSCGREVLDITSGFHMVLSSPEGYSKERSDWVNNVLLPFWKVEKEKLDDSNEAWEHPTPVPPSLPDFVTGYVLHDDVYTLVNHKESDQVAIPPDPDLVSHNKFWRGIIDEIELRSIVTEIPNNYFPDNGCFDRIRACKPWYTCQVNGATITFGPRKRVQEISVERQSSKFNVAFIGARAREDKTSYWADNRWQAWSHDHARSMKVHSWGREKFIEYMSIIMGALK